LATDLGAEIDVGTLAGLIDEGKAPVVLDVREPWEVALGTIEGALTIPLGELPEKAAAIPAGRPIVVLCHHGMRSAQAAGWLRRQGIAATNLRGGIDAWSVAVDPSVTRY
jgi:rhodanese-related sulfurtransferase